MCRGLDLRDDIELAPDPCPPDPGRRRDDEVEVAGARVPGGLLVREGEGARATAAIAAMVTGVEVEAVAMAMEGGADAESRAV